MTEMTRRDTTLPFAAVSVMRVLPRTVVGWAITVMSVSSARSGFSSKATVRPLRGDDALRRMAPGNPARRFAEIVTTVAELRPTMIDASSVLRRKAGAARFVVGLLVVAPCA